MIRLDSPTPSLAEVVKSLVDERVGIIRRIRELPRQAGGPDFFCFSAETCAVQVLCGNLYCGIPGGGGASVSRDAALAKAVGECVERYCATMYHPKEFPLYSFEAAPFPCVPPEEFALYGKQQYKQDDFPFVPFEKKTPTRWTAVLDPVTGETVYVPVAMVFLFTHGLKMNGEKPIAQSVSTGLACHLDPVRAAISAICEVIERDAFTITWQAMLPRPRIHTETLSEHNRNLLYRFERTGCQVALFYLRMDHRIPTVLAVSQSRGRETPALAFAAAANLDPEQAVRRSLEELAHTLPLAQWIKKSAHRLRPSPRYQNVVSLHDHANLYCDARNARLTDFLFSTQQRIGFDEIENISTANLKKDLKTLCDEVRRVNHRVLLADVTSDDVRQVGLAVIRAVIPGFHPLFFGHSLRALGGSRLWNVPLNLGFRGITPESGDNPAPHPFP